MVEPKYDIFISYSKTDSAFVRALTNALRDEGVQVWYDEGELRMGDSILRGIENALEQSRNFLLVISPDYLSSQWSQFEMGVAMSRAASSPTTRILPLFVREVEPSELPPPIARVAGMHVKDMPIEDVASILAKTIKDRKNGSSPTGSKQHVGSPAC